MKKYVVEKKKLFELFARLAREKEVVAPVRQENFTNYQKIKSSDEIVWGAPQTVVPPKKYLFPFPEELLAFEKTNGAFKVDGVNRYQNRILFGVHPCDLNAIYLMDQVFGEKNLDDNYLLKRKEVTLIGVDCLEVCSPEAICLRMKGLDPRERFDLFLTDVGGEFFARAATAKGDEIIKSIAEPASNKDEEKLKKIEAERDKLFDKKQKKLLPKYEDLPGLMKGGYPHPEWEERGKKCYACGSCNMVCPTCYCFDVLDYMKMNLREGIRERTWDGCMLEDFAKIASGENFREERSQRLRHRTYRKLYYLFEKWGQSFCTGCGRCIKACLTNIVSPLEIANALQEKGKA